MIDSAEWIDEQLSKATNGDGVTAMLVYLDETYLQADEHVRNVVDVTFIEWFQDSPLLRSLGPNLTTTAREMFPEKFRR